MASLAPLSLPYIVIQVLARPYPDQLQQILLIIDQVLCYGAALLTVGWAAWWVVRSPGDPLEASPPRPNTIREDAVLLAVLAYFTAAFVTSGVVRLLEGPDDTITSLLAVGNGAQLAGAAACLFIADRRFEGGIRRFVLGAKGNGPRSWMSAVLFVTLLALGLCPIVRDATVNSILYLAPDYEFTPHPTIKALHEHPQPLGIVVALWLGAILVAPLAEEFFFRGLLQTFLVGLVHSRWWAIGLTSFAFAAIHFTQPHAIAALLVLALLIGYAYERTGSLTAPIAIHAVFNLKTLIWEALGAPSG